MGTECTQERNLRKNKEQAVSMKGSTCESEKK